MVQRRADSFEPSLTVNNCSQSLSTFQYFAFISDKRVIETLKSLFNWLIK